jgi:hypothetical protein
MTAQGQGGDSIKPWDERPETRLSARGDRARCIGAPGETTRPSEGVFNIDKNREIIVMPGRLPGVDVVAKNFSPKNPSPPPSS